MSKIPTSNTDIQYNFSGMKNINISITLHCNQQTNKTRRGRTLRLLVVRQSAEGAVRGGRQAVPIHERRGRGLIVVRHVRDRSVRRNTLTN